MDDAGLVALKLVLSELGIPPKIDSVTDRKRIQKAVYIGQLSGVDLGYRYGWYLMGPYSPGLTRVYYDFDETPSSSDRFELTANVKRLLSKIKPLLSVPSKTELSQDDWLELVSSVHFLRKVSSYDTKKMRSVLEREKPKLVQYADKAETALKGASLL